MKCDFCEKNVDEGSKYCPYCGAKVKTAEKDEYSDGSKVYENAADTSPKTEEKEKETKRKTKTGKRG